MKTSHIIIISALLLAAWLAGPVAERLDIDLFSQDTEEAQ